MVSKFTIKLIIGYLLIFLSFLIGLNYYSAVFLIGISAGIFINVIIDEMF